MTWRPGVRGVDPQKPGEPTARRHPAGPEKPAAPPVPPRPVWPDASRPSRGDRDGL
ncbi:MAG: hypothetical protein ABW221_26810 [Vicinamibacteria bacterium]